MQTALLSLTLPLYLSVSLGSENERSWRAKSRVHPTYHIPTLTEKHVAYPWSVALNWTKENWFAYIRRFLQILNWLCVCFCVRRLTSFVTVRPKLIIICNKILLEWYRHLASILLPFNRVDCFTLFAALNVCVNERNRYGARVYNVQVIVRTEKRFLLVAEQSTWINIAVEHNAIALSPASALYTRRHSELYDGTQEHPIGTLFLCWLAVGSKIGNGKKLIDHFTFTIGRSLRNSKTVFILV